MLCLLHCHRQPCSDTDDTDSDSAIGGFGIYSHGEKCLTHQHWVKQLISAGSFSVHCTQSSEAAHKVSAKLAALRVRHLHVNKTQSSMSTYLCNYIIFEEIKHLQPADIVLRPRVRLHTGVRIPLLNPDKDIVTMETGASFDNVRFQKTFLHKEVLLARVELMNLLCDQFRLNKTLATYRLLNHLSYCFGQKLTRTDGKVFWSTDNQYSFDTSLNSHRRRDIFILKGTKKKLYRLPGGRYVEIEDALCAESVCFLTVSDLSNLPLPAFTTPRPEIPNAKDEELRSNIVNDSVTYCLVRWFEPHDTVQRDSDRRPMCPGPLHINHCCWRYAKTSEPRRVIEDSQADLRQNYMFGTSQQTRDDYISHIKNAYYGLIYPNNIVDIANMTPTFHPGSAKPNKNVWLQSVTII